VIVKVQKKNGKRDPVGTSAPTYPVELTRGEMIMLKRAADFYLETRRCKTVGLWVRLASARVMLEWASNGRQ
jgi:hypothetical protein